MDGWIKIHRKMTDWQWYGVSSIKDTFLHLLLTANHKDGFAYGTKLKKGQVLTSYNRISKDVGLSIQQVKTAIRKLVKTGEITQKSTNKFSIITICNYDSYQCFEEIEQQASNKQVTNKQQADNNQVTTYNNNKKEKNNNNISSLYSEERIEASKTAFYLEKQGESWRESVMMNLRIGKDDAKLNSLIIDFQNQLVSAGEAEKKETDLKSHFLNWARVFLREERRNQEKQKKNTRANKYADNISEQKYTEEW